MKINQNRIFDHMRHRKQGKKILGYISGKFSHNFGPIGIIMDRE